MKVPGVEALDDIHPSITIYPDDEELVRRVTNIDDIGEIALASDEGLPDPPLGNKKVFKVTVGANESKVLIVRVATKVEGSTIQFHGYVTGTASITAINGWTGTQPTLKLPGSWYGLWGRSLGTQIALKIDGGDNGGTAYISHIYITEANNFEVYSYPNQTLDGSTTYTYYFALPMYDLMNGTLRVGVYMAGDGTNPINADVYLRVWDGSSGSKAVKIASFSRTSSALGWYNLVIPVRLFLNRTTDIMFVNGSITVSGYGKIERYLAVLYRYGDMDWYFNGLKTASASNSSTTATTYTLIDNQGRANKYKDAQVVLNGTAGVAKLYVNGLLYEDASGTTKTVTLPDDMYIDDITVELAGDGTNASTAQFRGLELIGPYLVTRS